VAPCSASSTPATDELDLVPITKDPPAIWAIFGFARRLVFS
jgi:hypothetical protein